MEVKEVNGRHSTLCSVNDIHIGQTPKALKLFKQLIESENFDTIIEIGTHRGGFTTYLNNIKKQDTKLVTFEISEKNIDKQVLNSGIDIRIGDCFSDESVNTIIDFIVNSGKVLMLCDGGSKNKEFNTFSKYLKPDDVIMLHDYKDSEKSWNYHCGQNGWNFPSESSYNKILGSINNNNLKKYMYDEFCSVFWGSFIKDKI